MRYDAEIKVRIPQQWEDEIEKEASRDDVPAAQIYRKAIRQFLGRRAAVSRKSK